jgi:hypothetical protein
MVGETMTDPAGHQQGALSDQIAEAASKSPIARLALLSQSTIAALASLAGIAFIMLNSGYVDFYEKMGTHPEDVGLDRIGVLARTASFVYMAIAVAVAGLIIGAALRHYRSPWLRIAAGTMALIAAIIVLLTRQSHPSDLGAFLMILPATILIERILNTIRRRTLSWPFIPPPEDSATEPEGSEHAAETRGDSTRKWRTPPILFGVIVVFLGVGLTAENVIISSRVESALNDGNEVHPISFFSYPVLDISATHAHATWIDKEVPPPEDLRDPSLLYLGRNTTFASFSACGHAVVVPAVKVSIELRNNSSRQNTDRNEAFCGCINAGTGNCSSMLSPPSPPASQRPTPDP